MQRDTRNPKKFVISFRVNAQEWAALQKYSRKSGGSISKLLRANLQELLTQIDHSKTAKD